MDLSSKGHTERLYRVPDEVELVLGRWPGELGAARKRCGHVALAALRKRLRGQCLQGIHGLVWVVLRLPLRHAGEPALCFPNLQGECDINFLRQKLPLHLELSAHLQVSAASPPACLLAPPKFSHLVPKLGLSGQRLRFVVHRAYQLQLR